MQENDLLKQISFIKEIDKLKYIQRKTKLFNSDRPENDAEHSWHLAMMTIVLAAHSDKPIDVLKVLKMVLIHDIVEIDAGDTFIYDSEKNHTNTDEERLCAVPDIEEIAAYLFTIRVLKTEEKIWWPGWEIAVFGEGVPREYFNGIAVDSF